MIHAGTGGVLTVRYLVAVTIVLDRPVRGNQAPRRVVHQGDGVVRTDHQQRVCDAVDDGLKKTYGYYRCLPDACTAQLRFTADDVTAFKAGTTMWLNVVAFLPEDRRTPLRLQIPVSLKGFTKAFESLPVPVVEAAPAAQ